MLNKFRVLITDDEQYICDIMKELIQYEENCNVISVSDPAEAIKLLKENSFDLVLTDLIMGKFSGMQIMETALEYNPETVVILMTGYPTVENAIQALKMGAYDYLVKPFKLEALRSVIQRGLRKLQLSHENIHLKEQLAFFKISEAMSSTINLGEVLNQVLKLTMKEFRVDAASILFYDIKRKDKFVLKSFQSRPGFTPDMKFLEGQSEHSKKVVETNNIEIENIKSEKNTIDPFGDKKIKTFLSCPLLIQGNVIGLLNLQRENSRRELVRGELQSLKMIASKAAYAISNSRIYDDLHRAYLSTISAFANAIEARDVYTRGHTVRVTFLSELIATELGWDESKLQQLSMGGSLHDIGKMGVPDRILNKQGKLTEEEMGLMKQHPELGARMIEGIEFLKPCLPYILSHHERWDGTGYPNGYKEEEIPIEGRILSVADTFDAITTDRPYRDAAPFKHSLDELENNAGTQFDPHIVEIFLNTLEKNREKIEALYGMTFSENEFRKKELA